MRNILRMTNILKWQVTSVLISKVVLDKSIIIHIITRDHLERWHIGLFLAHRKRNKLSFSSKFREKPVTFWLSKVYVNEHRYKYTSFYWTVLLNSVSVVGSISQPNENEMQCYSSKLKFVVWSSNQRWLSAVHQFSLGIDGTYPTVGLYSRSQ